LLQYVYEGLLPMDRSMIDTTNGWAFIEKTLEEAWESISKMAENSQQFVVRVDSSRWVNKVIHSNIETKLSELTPLIKQVALGQVRQAKVYGITLSWTILLINAFKYKMMACLKLMS
jgi:hypothetical protein